MRLCRSRKSRVDIFRYLSVILISIFTTYAILTRFHSPHESRSYSVNPEFSFWANGTDFKGELVTINPPQLFFFFSYFDQYPCPYYADRADLIAPEINRLAQFMRSFGSKIIFHTKTVPRTTTATTVSIPAIADNHLSETSPLLDDKCLFDDYNEKPHPSNGSIHHDLLYATSTDFFADSPETALKIALEQKAQIIVTGGMKCNQWLPSFFEQAKAVGIEPLYLYDLSDVAYFRAAQQSKLETHVDALKFFWGWLVKKGCKIVNHFYLLDREPKFAPFANFKFDGNTAAYYFKDYFG
jgi:hypothetical protein